MARRTSAHKEQAENYKTHQKSGQGNHRSTGGERLGCRHQRAVSRSVPRASCLVHRPSTETTEQPAPREITRASSVREENPTSVGQGHREAPEEAHHKEKED